MKEQNDVKRMYDELSEKDQARVISQIILLHKSAAQNITWPEERRERRRKRWEYNE